MQYELRPKTDTIERRGQRYIARTETSYIRALILWQFYAPFYVSSANIYLRQILWMEVGLSSKREAQSTADKAPVFVRVMAVHGCRAMTLPLDAEMAWLLP